MKYKGCMLIAVFALFLGFVAPVWALQTAAPLEQSYAQHVIPYYNVTATSPSFLSFLVLADTSHNDFAVPATIGLWFFNQACVFQRDARALLTGNDVFVVSLNSPALALPSEGAIFLDSGNLFNPGVGGACLFINDSGGCGPRYIAYLILVSVTEGTLTRIDSIPFSPAQLGPPPIPVGGLPGHWTRYDTFHTIAATFGDIQSATPGTIRTTLTFFTALGGSPVPPLVVPGALVGGRDTLREFMSFYGYPRVGDWQTGGGSATAEAGAGTITLFAYDENEFFLGSAHLTIRCFERIRLGNALLFPILASIPGHLIAFADVQPVRTQCFSDAGADAGRCAFSVFQETVVEQGAFDMIFSGYAHHSNNVP